MKPPAAPPQLEQLLLNRLPAKQVRALLQHFQFVVDEFQKGEWESAIAKAGKFVEATLKALWAHLGNPLPKAKDFKVDITIRQLEQTPAANADDTVRVTIPRACRFIYEVASNRGARHDPDEVNPNQMDAAAVVSLCSWILAEIIRYCTKGAVDLTMAAQLVLGLSQKRFPAIEEIDGRIYFHIKGLSARDVAVLTLWRVHPGRASRGDLVAAIMRHGFSRANAAMAISRLDHLVDNDGQESFRLLAPGILEAEKLMATTNHKLAS